MNLRWNQSRGRGEGRRGFVLVPVIWISGILAAFAISVSVSVRSHALYARNAMSEVLAGGIADGMVRLTGLSFSTATPAPAADGTWQRCRWADEAVVAFAVQDQSGLVDLNTASPPLMLALLEGLGLSNDDAMAMAAAIRDYRDADHVSDLGLSEPALYPGRAFGPKDAPFEAVEELDQVPGMTPGLFAALRQLTTVHTQQAGFDFGTAPEPLLKVLGLTRTSAAGLSFSAPRTSPMASVEVAVELGDGTRFVRRAMIARTGQPQRPFAVLGWDLGDWPSLPPDEERGAAWPCLKPDA